MVIMSIGSIIKLRALYVLSKDMHSKFKTLVFLFSSILFVEGSSFETREMEQTYLPVASIAISVISGDLLKQHILMIYSVSSIARTNYSLLEK